MVFYWLIIITMSLGTLSLGNTGGGNLKLWEIALVLTLLYALARAMIYKRLIVPHLLSLVVSMPLLAAHLFSGVNALDTGFWMKSAILLLGNLLLFSTVAQTRSKEVLRRHLGFILIPGVVLAVWGIVSMFLHPLQSQPISVAGMNFFRAKSVFAEANEFSQYLVVPFAFLLAALVVDRRADWARRVLYWAAMTIVVIAQLLSFSRGGILAFLASGLVLALIKRKSLPSVKRLLYFVLLACTTLGLGLFLLSENEMVSAILNLLAGRMGALTGGGDATAALRYDYIITALTHAIASPTNFLLGIGAGNLRLILDSMDNATTANALVDVFAETGLFGLLSFAALVGVCLAMPWKMWGHVMACEDAEAKTVAIGSLLALAGLLIGGMTYATHMLPFFWVVCGMVCSIPHCFSQHPSEAGR